MRRALLPVAVLLVGGCVGKPDNVYHVDKKTCKHYVVVARRAFLRGNLHAYRVANAQYEVNCKGSK